MAAHHHPLTTIQMNLMSSSGLQSYCIPVVPLHLREQNTLTHKVNISKSLIRMVNPDLQTSSYKFHFLYANKPMKQYSISQEH